MKKVAAVLLLFAILILTSCSVQTERDFFAMDTLMQIKLYGGKEQQLDVAEELIKELDGRFSVSSANGEVTSLNTDGMLNNPSSELLEMLECAELLYERTGGAYDITSLALTELWKLCEDENRLPTDAEIQQTLALVGMGKISFDESSVRLGGVKGIDLGSVAKGFAGREAAKTLEVLGVSGGVLTLGGNVEVFGEKPSGEPFKVGITDPSNPEAVCGYVTVSKGSVVTSGKYNRYYSINGERYHHIIDAQTGKPCDNGVASVTVIYNDGMWADGLSTALFLLGEQGAIDYHAQYGGFQAVIVMDDGRVVNVGNADFVAV